MQICFLAYFSRNKDMAERRYRSVLA